MSKLRSALLVASLALTSAAMAQEAPPAIIRGTIETVSADGLTLALRTKQGEQRTLRLKQPPAIIAAIPATLADIKPGLFIGTAALPGPDGALKAMEVHIFAESMRGLGEGFRPFDLAPRSTMTNGSVAARVEGVDGPRLTVTYKGGEQTVAIDAATPIVSFVPGEPADLRKDASILARGIAKAADGVDEVARVIVGRNGLKLPM